MQLVHVLLQPSPVDGDGFQFQILAIEHQRGVFPAHALEGHAGLDAALGGIQIELQFDLRERVGVGPVIQAGNGGGGVGAHVGQIESIRDALL